MKAKKNNPKSIASLDSQKVNIDKIAGGAYRTSSLQGKSLPTPACDLPTQPVNLANLQGKEAKI